MVSHGVSIPEEAGFVKDLLSAKNSGIIDSAAVRGGIFYGSALYDGFAVLYFWFGLTLYGCSVCGFGDGDHIEV